MHKILKNSFKVFLILISLSLINFKVYGDKSTRAKLLSKWDNDVSVIPR